jgi:hypothetical protein
MDKSTIIKTLREMAKHPTVTLPRDCEALKAAADLIEQTQKPVLTFDGLTATEFGLLELYKFQEATKCDTADEFIEQAQKQERTGSCPLEDCDGGPETHGCWAHNCEWKAQKQEPVAWMFQHEETGRTICVDAQQLEWGFEKGNPRLKKVAPLYTTPPQRTWLGLTDVELSDLSASGLSLWGLWRAIEAKLKEKNA